MLKIYNDFIGLNISGLLDLYQESMKMAAKQEGISLRQAEDSFIDYLRNDFFSCRDSFYAVLTRENKYMSAVRMEPHLDGWLLSGLETHPEHRSAGNAEELINQVLLHVCNGPVYVHVHKKNPASLAVHKKCGFEVISDYGKLLDGTVSREYCTLINRNAHSA